MAKIKKWIISVYQKGDLRNPFFLAAVILAVLAATSTIGLIVTITSLAFQGNENTGLREENIAYVEEIQELRSKVRKDSNPILRTVGLENVLLSFESKTLSDGKQAKLLIQDGKIKNCLIGYDNGNNSRLCKIEGLAEEIYKVVDVDFGPPSENNFGVGFITKLGKLYYVRIADLVESGNVTVSQRISFERPVIDVLQGYIEREGGGEYVPLLIFSNNDYRKLKKEELAR